MDEVPAHHPPRLKDDSVVKVVGELLLRHVATGALQLLGLVGARFFSSGVVREGVVPRYGYFRKQMFPSLAGG